MFAELLHFFLWYEVATLAVALQVVTAVDCELRKKLAV
jgi:hypothetical protein